MIEITVAYYLGIDGGGSKTTCVVGDENAVLASATAGPSNITRVGEERARESIHQAIHAACDAAKVTPRQIVRTCVGAAGAARAEVADTVRKFTAQLVSGEIEVVTDIIIAMEAAFGSGPGVIVNAGTGSFAYGRNTRGETARAGGWGFAIGDEGSAYWIGHQAVAASLRASDEKECQGLATSRPAEQASLPDTPLSRALLATLNVSSLEHFVRAANSTRDFAALFPAVLAAADAGDDVARGIMEKAAAELARLAAIVVCRLFPVDDSSVVLPIPVAMAGGVFRHSQKLRESFSEHSCTQHPRIALNPEIVEPVYGALQMARRPKS